jgi:hypothetical protein
MAIESLLMLALLAGSASAQKSNLILPQCKFADTYQFGSTECAMEFRNTGDKPIAIDSIKPASPRDSITPTSLTVAPHASAYARAVISPSQEIGRVRRIFRFNTDELGQAARTAEAMGFVASVLDEPKPLLDFGVVNVPGAPVQRSVRLESREVPDFKIESIVSAPSYVDARISEDGRSVSATIKPIASWGLHEADHISLKVNTPRQSEVWVGLRADVHGEVVPSANPFSLGLFRKGSKNEFSIRLTSRSGKDFAIGKVTATGLSGQASVEPCLPAVEGCKLVRYTVSDDQQTGPIAAVLKIGLPDFERELPVVAWGMLVDKDTKVRDFNAEMEKAAEAPAEGGISKASAAPKIDLGQALKRGVEEPAESVPDGKGPLLKWSVVHESMIHGYVIYRADAEKGPFVRINADTVLTKSKGDEGANYQWRDTTAVSGKAYWYYIGVVNGNGTKKSLTAPQKVIAKQ